MPPLIQLEHISKLYQRGQEVVRALDDVSLTVTAGEFVAIVGQSGSGKSTLMNIVGCLDTPTHGEYRLDGHVVSALNDRALSVTRNRHIGFVFQGFNLVAGLTALENVELPLQYRGMSRAARRTLAVACLEQVGLTQRLHHRPSEMSGGQQQRVAIARALASRPPILLADEPTGNLDEASGREIMAILRSLHADGTTIVLITHDNTIAAQLPRRIRISEGRLTDESG